MASADGVAVWPGPHTPPITVDMLTSGAPEPSKVESLEIEQTL